MKNISVIIFPLLFYCTIFPANAQKMAFAKEDSTNRIAASLYLPSKVAVDGFGNVYVAEFHEIRKISPEGIVTKVAGGSAGYKDGTGTYAGINRPEGLAVDVSGNLFVVQASSNKIRKVTPEGMVTTFASGNGSSANFRRPSGIAVDVLGNLYVTDLDNKIYKITADGVVSIFAGSGIIGDEDGTGTEASFNHLTGIAIDGSGDLYVTDIGNNKIRKITPNGKVTTFSGTSISEGTHGNKIVRGSFNATGITVDQLSGNVYISDYTKIRKITPKGIVSPFAGSGRFGNMNGTGSAVDFNSIRGIATDLSGNIYAADASNNLIRKISPTGIVSTLAGDGINTVVSFYSLRGLAVDIHDNVYATDCNYFGNHYIRKVTPAGLVTIVAGSGGLDSIDGIGTAAGFNRPIGITVDTSGNLYVADSGNNRIRKITPEGVVTTFAGSGVRGSSDGKGNEATFNRPMGIAVDRSGNVYVADTFNDLIRKITPDGIVTTLAGTINKGSNDGKGVAASFNGPSGLAVDISGSIYVADTYNNLIRKITPDAIVTTLAGSGNQAYMDGIGIASSFFYPNSIVVDTSGNVYVADTQNHFIRKITPAGVVTTLAGSGDRMNINSTGTMNCFSFPGPIAIDHSGNIYATDNNQDSSVVIRKITPAGVVTLFAGSEHRVKP